MPPRWRALAYSCNLMQRLGGGAYFLAPMVQSQQTAQQQGKMARKDDFVKIGEARFLTRSTGKALKE
jgi:hypothetical protein